MTTDADVVSAAYDVLEEINAGTLTGAQLETHAAEVMRREFGTVGGEDDPLWPVHLDVCRQFLAAGGLTSGELREWLAVQLRSENGTTDSVAPPEVAVEPEGEPDDLADVPESVLADAEAAALAVIERWRTAHPTTEEPRP